MGKLRVSVSDDSREFLDVTVLVSDDVVAVLVGDIMYNLYAATGAEDEAQTYDVNEVKKAIEQNAKATRSQPNE